MIGPNKNRNSDPSYQLQWFLTCAPLDYKSSKIVDDTEQTSSLTRISSSITTNTSVDNLEEGRIEIILCMDDSNDMLIEVPSHDIVSATARNSDMGRSNIVAAGEPEEEQRLEGMHSLMESCCDCACSLFDDI